MAKVRSPNYPVMDLGSALKAARKAFDKDNRNKMSQEALGKHLGHESLSGPALGKIGALRAYGLVEGKGDELRITDEAVHALMAPMGSSHRANAIALLADRPKLFQDIRKDFATLPSLENLKFWLIKRQYKPEAAEKAAKCYLATMRLVAGGEQEYDSEDDDTASPENPPMTPQHQPLRRDTRQAIPITPSILNEGIKVGTRQEIITLDEGDVVITFPKNLSAQSFNDLKDHLELFVKKMQRRAYIPPQHGLGEKPAKTILGTKNDEAAK
jgi:hypothetical protein